MGWAATQYLELLSDRAAKANDEINAAKKSVAATITRGDLSESCEFPFGDNALGYPQSSFRLRFFHLPG